jgi:hypothetical protein
MSNNKKIYFTKGTEEAIVTYTTIKNKSLRERFYVQNIRTPIRQLIEAVIQRYKFHNTGLDFNDLIDDSEGFLLTHYPKYQSSKGRAFSYFTVILRNYIQLLSRKNQQGIKMTVEIEDDWFIHSNLDPNFEAIFNDNNKIGETVENRDNSLFISKLIEAIKAQCEEGYPVCTSKDQIVYDALILVLEHYPVLEIFNKKYLLFILREMTDLKTKSISISLKKLGDIYHVTKQKYL